MHINKLCVVTDRGNLLNGSLFEDGNTDTVLICVTGLHGNSFTNPFLRDMGRRLAKSGINFILAESSDAHPLIESYNIITQKVDRLGSGTSRLKNCIDDIGSYISKAESMGYKHIYLAGHCLGSSKVIHYLASTRDPRIERFILFNPGDHGQFMAEVSEDEKRTVLKLMQEGRGDEMLPFALMGWFHCSVATAYDYVCDECIIYNCSADKEAPRDDLKKLNYRGLFVIGECDVYPVNGPLEYIKHINSETPYRESNDLLVIPGADHIFKDKGEALADAILPVIQRWIKEDSLK